MMLACAMRADAQEVRLTLADVLSRARDSAPAVALATAEIDEARSRVTGAALRSQTNPELELGAGPRGEAGTRSADFTLGLSQSFEPGSRKDARRASASADIDSARAQVDDVRRQAMRDAAGAFLVALHARALVESLDGSLATSRRLLDIAQRRVQAGDAAVLDVNLARLDLGRTQAESENAKAAYTMAVGTLRLTLGLPRDRPLVLDGQLDVPGERALDDLLGAISQRPDVARLATQIRGAQADQRFGASFSRPEYAVGVEVRREADAHILFGGVKIGLPVFNSGQQIVSAADAERRRLELQQSTLVAAAQIRVSALVEALVDKRRALVSLGEAVSGATENETLAQRSYEAGQIGLADSLVVRRELDAVRHLYLSQLLDVALTVLDRDFEAGVLR
jgi:cobalt-zinc-cadmium efflux system outer membrane protein